MLVSILPYNIWDPPSLVSYKQHFIFYSLFVCLGLTSLLNIGGHIMTAPASSSGTLTNVLPHRNVMLQTQDTPPHPVTVYRHGADLSLCYTLMLKVTLEYTITHFNVLGKTGSGKAYAIKHRFRSLLCEPLVSSVGSAYSRTEQRTSGVHFVNK